MSEQEAIDEIMDWFDFGKVAKAMKALDWGWGLSSKEVPIEQEIRVKARGLLNELRDRKLGAMKTGGLCATRREFEDGVHYSLSFEVAEWDVFTGDEQ